MPARDTADIEHKQSTETSPGSLILTAGMLGGPVMALIETYPTQNVAEIDCACAGTAMRDHTAPAMCILQHTVRTPRTVFKMLLDQDFQMVGPKVKKENNQKVDNPLILLYKYNCSVKTSGVITLGLSFRATLLHHPGTILNGTEYEQYRIKTITNSTEA